MATNQNHRRCRNCIYYEKADHILKPKFGRTMPSFGGCRKQGPKVFSESGVAIWPITWGDIDWCGDFDVRVINVTGDEHKKDKDSQ